VPVAAGGAGEWVSNAQLAGAWAQLTWRTTRSLTRLVLRDRREPAQNAGASAASLDSLATTSHRRDSRGRDTGQAFDEDLPAARAISAAKAAGPEVQLHLAPLPRQIAKPAFVLTVIRHASTGAHGTAG
jgi:hypothetical protein